ncbi:DNA topoisomerase 3-beta isoform X1 [Chlorella sorokiniana]|uniref:DNA topoisomerase 3-beta n=1 Tax=Chlorella sorokiniana TaxID=3076 RepID=A0A2P6U1G8_CHLSO|nr:DNA topoisomerase 3-beta isoform X1 [Chlorella sorokiniana]|eukprot:PRW60157.1 DNA topoisomerase 3-beta isoform X1 [Chlorella sorokiniana]
MGPTGSGKSSLLNALAGRLPAGGSLEGEVLVNGAPRDAQFRSISAFDDIMFPNLTVRETMLFAARIRLPASISDQAKGALVDAVIGRLGLAKAAGTLVGSAAERGISGGERKRVNIGLDAFQAQSVMEALHTLAGDGRTVVFCIHQPRSSIYDMFDQLLLISEGCLCYAGPAAAAAAHFAAAGHLCPPGHSVADFLLDIASVDFRSPEAEAASRARVKGLADVCAAQGAAAAGKDADPEAQAQQIVAVHAVERTPTSSREVADEAELPKFANNPAREFQLLLSRSARQASRNHLEHIVLLSQTAIIAASFAILFSGLDPSKPGGIQDEVSLLFLSGVTVAMNSMMGCILLLSLEQQVVNRERASRAYRIGPYYLARLITAAPLRVIQGLLFSGIMYWAAGLNPSVSAFFIFVALIICEDLAGQALGLAISAAVPHEKIAMAIAPLVVVLLMLFSGFYINASTIPAALAWIKWLSHLYYGLMGLAINDFSGRGGWACPLGSPPGCSVSGEAILQQLGFGGRSLGTAFMGLAVLTVGFNLLGYLALRVRKPRYLALRAAKKRAQLIPIHVQQLEGVLMVAEKPSLAKSIAEFLSEGRMSSRHSNLDVHEWQGSFQGRPALFRMTSVIGHVLSIDFPADYQSWEKVDPATLFDAPTLKSEANPKARVVRHLQQEAKGCDYLVLWLDCDREGENICFEVIENTVPKMSQVPGQQVFRARFSAISAPEIRAAMARLVQPNQCEALAVDARQELDLKVGVAFTRFQSRFFQAKYGNLDSAVISYGPCQTPTLGFCVERHQAIVAFQPEPFWVVRPRATKAGHALNLEWGRGRVFDAEVGAMFQRLVVEAKQLRVVDVGEKEERKGRPHGLNTVELLKTASSSLGIGPAYAMQVAERLYTQGYLSYPRTESTAYPPNFDFHTLLAAQRSHPIWGEYAASLIGNFSIPKGGTDVGDHPPITPVRCATEAELGGGDAWRLYDFVARHFLGSLSPDCVYKKSKASFATGSETFSTSGTTVVRPGFTAIMPWTAVQNAPLPPLQRGETIPIAEVELHQGKTSPPDYLTEAELIGLMEKHGIGTDASIPVHINNVCERNYVSIQSGRRCVPTELGITLIRGYQLIDPELCRPQVRAYVERQIDLVAKGEADKEAVVAHCLHEFKAKFAFFVAHIQRMDTLFEASFSPLASSGKVLSQCGKCRRYMKLIASRPSRLYCPTCEDVYNMPQGGSIKLYKELACPLDGFQLLLFSLGGADGKTYPLCPYCYNHPPFEDAPRLGDKASGGMPCTLCTHPTCRHSPARMGVAPCPACEGEAPGTLVLDPVSAPAWRLDCSRCSFLIYLPKNLHSAKLAPDSCEECGSTLLALDWKKGQSPLAGGDTQHTGCVVCDPLLTQLCEVKHGRAFVRRGGRGRGRGS